MDNATLTKLIDKKDEYTVGALLHVYRFQTLDEQQMEGTVHDNGVGFNGLDAGPMSSIAKWYLDKGFITPRQVAFVRKTMKKYVNQIVSTGGCQPAELKKGPAQAARPTTSRMKVEYLDANKKSFKVTFWFPKGDGRFSSALALVKSLPNRNWNGQEKYWRVGVSLEAVDKLRDFGFEIDQAILDWADSIRGKTATEIDGIDVPGFNGTLMPFQRQGVAFIEDRNGRALVGDEMGLGKTIQAIGYMQLHPEKRPAVVVCPASLKKNWYKEIKRFMPADTKVTIVDGRFNYDAAANLNAEIYIVNYDILVNQTEMAPVLNSAGQPVVTPGGKIKKQKVEIRHTGWGDWLVESLDYKCLVLDECHYCKDSKALRTKAVQRLTKKEDIACIGLSGTPIVNRASEFYNAISFIQPSLFPSWWKFMQRYTNAQHNGFGWEFKGSRNEEELHKMLVETIMIRRLKKDVLTELPDKVRAIVPFDLANRSEYDHAAEDILQYLASTQGLAAAQKAENAEVLVKMEKLKQLALDGKLQQVVQWVKDFLLSDQKLVLFATHTKTLDVLQKQFGDIAVRIDGSTPQAKRQNIVDQFQEDDSVRLFLGNVKAAGVGLTLTAASNVAFVELPWTPGDFEQAADRCHRIGQQDTVNVWVLVAENTIEEAIAEMLDEKRKTLDAVLDGKETDAGSVLGELIKRMREEYREAA